jgi:DNA-binding CsgD family transcriptional regulator
MIRLVGDHHCKREQAESVDLPEAEMFSGVDWLNLVSSALLLVDEGLHIIRSNLNAQEFLTGVAGEGVARMLASPAATQSQELRRHVREAISANVRSMMLLQPDRPQSLICNILPFRGAAFPCALLVLTSLTGGSERVVPYLKALYKLSNAEAEIAAAAAAGLDVVQMAHSRNVSIHTLRAQIAAIKAKMGLSRMTEIAVTVGRIEAAVTWF